MNAATKAWPTFSAAWTPAAICADRATLALRELPRLTDFVCAGWGAIGVRPRRPGAADGSAFIQREPQWISTMSSTSVNTTDQDRQCGEDTVITFHQGIKDAPAKPAGRADNLPDAVGPPHAAR